MNKISIMAKQKQITKDLIIERYMDALLVSGSHPSSVYAFAAENKFEESDFYRFFGSFEALEQALFEHVIDRTVEVLHASEDYKTYNAQNKLLSFYYTCFENLSANRSFFIKVLSSCDQPLKSVKLLNGFRKRFMAYLDTLELETPDIPNEKLDAYKMRAINESFWFQFVSVLKFWMDDQSSNFEKTDIFIEKSVTASFDLMHIAPIKSVLDLGRFLVKEKFSMN